MAQTYEWRIQVWNPHFLGAEHEYTYTAKTPGAFSMTKLCYKAIADAQKDYPDINWFLMGTTAVGQVLPTADLLKAHPDKLNHTRCPDCPPE